MTQSNSSSNNTDSTIASFSIYVNGSPIDASILIQSIQINKSINYPDKAEIYIIEQEGGNDALNPFPVFNSNVFKAGASIVIHLGYGQDLNQVFEGTILNQLINQFSTNPCTLKITCIGITPVITASDMNSLPPATLKLSYGDNIISFSLVVLKEQSTNHTDWLGGSINIQGSSAAQINSLVTLRGFGHNILDDAYVASVDHTVESGNWLTTIELGQPKPITFSI